MHEYDDSIPYGEPDKPYLTRFGEGGKQWTICWSEDELEAVDLWCIDDDDIEEPNVQLFQVREMADCDDLGHFMFASWEAESFLAQPFEPNVQLLDGVISWI